MSMGRGLEVPEPFGRRREDAVACVRRAMERARAGKPLLRSELVEVEGALTELKDRLARLRSLGSQFSEVELSVCARELLRGGGRMPVVS